MRKYADQRINKIEERLKGEFTPLLCVVEVTDYEAKLNFKVFNVVDDNKEGVFEKNPTNNLEIALVGVNFCAIVVASFLRLLLCPQRVLSPSWSVVSDHEI